MAEKTLRIGELAAGAGVNPKTIRYYEALGVLPPAARGANSYRRYPPETVGLVSFVKQAQGLGFTLHEIKEIVSIRRRGEVPCIHVRSLLTAKARELDRKLEDLMALRRRIRQSLAVWGEKRAGTAVVCPHIEGKATRASKRRGGGPLKGRR